MENTSKKKCTCRAPTCPNPEQGEAQVLKKSVRTIPSIMLSFFIAFFPKCPICWAVYMSMLGSFGIAEIPYMKWLLPVFMVFLVIHLGLLLKKASTKGYGPFLLSLFGFCFLIPSKLIFNMPEWITVLGMSCIVIGSLWNSFSFPQKVRLTKVT